MVCECALHSDVEELGLVVRGGWGGVGGGGRGTSCGQGDVLSCHEK